MTEIEQLRKELNELRERVAVLEGRSVMTTQYTPRPTFVPTLTDPFLPPFTITCKE